MTIGKVGKFSHSPGVTGKLSKQLSRCIYRYVYEWLHPDIRMRGQ